LQNEKIEKIISSAVETTAKAIETCLSTQISFLSKTTSETAESLVQLKSAVDTQNNSLTRLHELDNKLVSTTESMTSHIQTYKDALISQPPAQDTAKTRSSDASARDSAIRSRKAVQDRQLMVIFRPVTDETKSEFDKLNLEELKKKAIDLQDGFRAPQHQTRWNSRGGEFIDIAHCSTTHTMQLGMTSSNSTTPEGARGCKTHVALFMDAIATPGQFYYCDGRYADSTLNYCLTQSPQINTIHFLVLSCIAHSVLCIPGVSTSLERLFSSCRHTMAEEGTSLNTESVYNMVITKK
jgi:hypothetical protein